MTILAEINTAPDFRIANTTAMILDSQFPTEKTALKNGKEHI